MTTVTQVPQPNKSKKIKPMRTINMYLIVLPTSELITRTPFPISVGNAN